MKKYLMFMLAAAFMTSCSDNNENLPEDDGDDSGKTSVFEEHDGYFIYHGETYKTVKLANGTTWMAEPLRYVPEGYTPSGDPTTDSHIWYPYKLIVNEGNNTINADNFEVLKDETSIKKHGYLYDMYAALGGKEVTEDNCYEFEGTQGICPEGWHIPTHAEYLALVGNTAKDVDGNTPSDAEKAKAIFYNKDYDGAKIQSFIDAGLNYQFSGVRMSTGYTSTPRYQLNVIGKGNSTKTEWYESPAMNYYMTSTAYKPIYNSTTNILSNIQFFGLMSTFTLAKYPEGRLTLAYISVLSGQMLRCVKDQK